MSLPKKVDGRTESALRQQATRERRWPYLNPSPLELKVSGLLPANLPEELRAEAGQAVVAEVESRGLRVPHLRPMIRRHVAVARKGFDSRFTHKSLTDRVAGTETLVLLDAIKEEDVVKPQSVSSSRPRCAVVECRREARAHGLCKRHYQQRRLGKSAPRTYSVPDESRRKCSVAACEREHDGGGLCHAHGERKRLGLPIEAPIMTDLNACPICGGEVTRYFNARYCDKSCAAIAWSVKKARGRVRHLVTASRDEAAAFVRFVVSCGYRQTRAGGRHAQGMKGGFFSAQKRGRIFWVRIVPQGEDVERLAAFAGEGALLRSGAEDRGPVRVAGGSR